MTPAAIQEVAKPTIYGRNELLTSAHEIHERVIGVDGGVLLVDKPYGETSFYVVNRIRKQISRSTEIKWVKVGHAGTLDPLATGLLLIATRRSTKALASLTGLDKTYLVTVRFGIRSASYDLEQPIEIVGGIDSLEASSVASTIEMLVGAHDQIPPAFSAIKQQGRPVYHRAREGQHVMLGPRAIEVKLAEVISIDLPFATFRVLCSKGTYIRSIVRDVGESLGTGAVLTDLRRETVGDWNVSNALSLEEAVALAGPDFELTAARS